MDREDRLVKLRAIAIYGESGMDAYSIIQKLADTYIGDGSKRKDLLERIAQDESRERMKIECFFGAEESNKIMNKPYEISIRLRKQSEQILNLACSYIMARLNNPEEKRTAREFIDYFVRN